MTEDKIACTLCGSPEVEKVSDKIRYGADKKVYSCKSCEIVFLYPQMEEEEEREYYKEEYRKLFSYGNSAVEHFQRALPEAIKKKDMLKEYLSKDFVVLEIGCATGYFLHAIKDLVKEAHGVEPHKEHSMYVSSLGFKTFNSYAQCQEGSYDVIFMFMTLEHLRDPLIRLKEIKSLLKKDGILVVEVPNVNDALISVFNIETFKNYYWQGPHYWYFSPKTLKALLSKAGFATKLIPVQRYDLSNNITWMLEGKPGGQGKYNNIFSDELNRLYASALCEKFVCDTIVSISKTSEIKHWKDQC